MSLFEYLPAWIELVFFYGIAFGFGAYQIWSVNREIAKDKRAREEQEKAQSPPRAGHSEGEHELDDR